MASLRRPFNARALACPPFVRIVFVLSYEVVFFPPNKSGRVRRTLGGSSTHSSKRTKTDTPIVDKYYLQWASNKIPRLDIDGVLYFLCLFFAVFFAIFSAFAFFIFTSFFLAVKYPFRCNRIVCKYANTHHANEVLDDVFNCERKTFHKSNI